MDTRTTSHAGRSITKNRRLSRIESLTPIATIVFGNFKFGSILIGYNVYPTEMIIVVKQLLSSFLTSNNRVSYLETLDKDPVWSDLEVGEGIDRDSATEGLFESNSR